METRTSNSVSDVSPGDPRARGLLDGREPLDSATISAIEQAFVGGSTDPVLHAAALWLAFTTNADLRVSRSRLRQWIRGVQELIRCGHLEAAAYAVTRLRAVFPQRPFLESMDLVLSQMPPEAGNGRKPFVDDPGEDVQIVVSPGANTVVIDFCGAGHGPGLPIQVMDRWFAQLNAHFVYLRDRRKLGYTAGIRSLGPGPETMIDGLLRVVSDLDAPRVVCLGNSAGGSGALRFAQALGAERVLALVPITGGPEYDRANAPYLPLGGERWWGDLVPLYRAGDGVRARILYGEKNESDGEQCTRMAGLPGVTVEALSGWEEHHLFVGLLRAGLLEQVLGWLVSEDDLDLDPPWRLL